METLRKKLTGILAAAMVVVFAGVANAGYFDTVKNSFDREFTEPSPEYDFGPVVASFDRLLSEEPRADIHQVALRSYERLLGEGIFVKSGDKLGEYELALAGWDEMITKSELCGGVNHVLVACATVN
ncbi:MAG: hypothetical protein ACNS63_05100 [Candidatus Nitrospinota bacterium M3_3B_026]